MQVYHMKDVGASVLFDKLSWYENNGYSLVLIFVAISEYEKFKDFSLNFGGLKIKIVGGFFPNISFENILYEDGALLIGVNGSIAISKINTTPSSDALPNQEKYARSALAFLDALSDDAEEHIHIINTVLDPNLPIIGMGAGAMDFVHRPILFTNDGFEKNSSLLVLMDANISQATTHGYEAIAGPFLVTKTDGLDTHELNYQPAFAAYVNAIQEVDDVPLEQSNFFEWSKDYPLGIENSDGTFILRDAIKTDGNSFSCVYSVPQNSIIYIMKGNAQALIENTKAAALNISNALIEEKQSEPQLVFSIGCITRKLFLGDAYEDELAAVSTVKAARHVGILSMGEVSNYNASNATLLNKTLVVGIF